MADAAASSTARAANDAAQATGALSNTPEIVSADAEAPAGSGGDNNLLRRLRRRLRRLYDATDGFRSLFMPSLSRPFMASLGEIRRILDDVDDLRQTRDLLRSPGIRADAVRSALLERRIAEGLGQLPEAWTRFKQIEPFWKRSRPP